MKHKIEDNRSGIFIWPVRTLILTPTLQELLGAFPEDMKHDARSRKYDDPLRNAEKGGRLWKFSELDDRIKNIDKELKALVTGDVKEQKQETKIDIQELESISSEEQQ